jgi:hypothetical protein
MAKQTGKQKTAKKATTSNKRIVGKQKKVKSRLALTRDVKDDHQR